MPRVMIVDDELVVRELVERGLSRHGYEVVVAQSGMEAIDLLRYRKPDVAILDIGMPRISGIEVCRFMRTNPSLVSIPILFLTGKRRIEDKIICFEAGADDYLTKPFDIRELVLRVKALLNRVVRIVPEGPLSIGDVFLDPSTGEARINGDLARLTSVEFELLYYVASRAGEVFSTKELLREVWGYPPGTGNPSLVRMHVLNLRANRLLRISDKPVPLIVCLKCLEPPRIAPPQFYAQLSQDLRNLDLSTLQSLLYYRPLLGSRNCVCVQRSDQTSVADSPVFMNRSWRHLGSEGNVRTIQWQHSCCR